jgi:hypothetical protein
LKSRLSHGKEKLMGAHPYFYVVKYQPDLNRALQELREREFQAGRYNPVMPFLPFPIRPSSPAPGPAHASIQQAIEASDADGTRSILDIQGVADEPDFCVAAPLPAATLRSLYGTDRPSRAMVEQNMVFLEDVERGHCVYIILYSAGAPDEVLFAGYSFD